MGLDLVVGDERGPHPSQPRRQRRDHLSACRRRMDVQDIDAFRSEQRAQRAQPPLAAARALRRRH
ncbi:MAG: hypothetical protein C4290_01195 [Chloroflexota bacterium]